MDLYPSDDQAAFRQASIDWLAGNMPLEAARARPRGQRDGIAAMGWLQMSAPADSGGLGLDHATEALVFAELGRHLAPVAVMSSAVAARWFGRTGKVALAIRPSEATRVFDPADAPAALLATSEGALILAVPAGTSSRASLDLSTDQAILAAPQTLDTREGAGAYRHLMLLAAAYALGTADAACAMAAAYASIREQFGQPIGAFQGVKHPCADMAVRCAVARSQLYYAACSLDAAASDAAFHVAAAKRLCDGAALDNARANIQVHGGIGMTDDASPHLLLKRAHLLQFVCPAQLSNLLERRF